MQTPQQTIDSLLRAVTTRVVLSVAIVASLVLIEMSPALHWTLFAIFAAESVLRTIAFVANIRASKVRVSEGLILVVAVAATASFVPISGPGASLLMLGRIARLALLFTYWGPLARDFATIALQRERLSQIFLVMGMALMLTGTAASLVRMIRGRAVDLDANGRSDDYFDLLWWAARQVLDPGNLVEDTSKIGLLAISFVLTVGGLLLMAVLIGIGSSLVEDLVRAGRSRPVDMSRHTIVLNVAEENKAVLHNMTAYFAKHLTWRHVALQGRWDERPSFLDHVRFRSFQYRGGRAADATDLGLLDAHKARRVAILAPGGDAEADADSVTAVLTTRTLNERAWIVVELNQPGNIPAALKAGRQRTVPVPARRLSALVLAQELVDPGRAGLIQDFVALEGHELYTAIFGDGPLAHIEEVTLDRPFTQLRMDVLVAHRCLLIGYFQEPGRRTTPWIQGLDPVLNPSNQPNPVTIRGLIALAPSFNELLEATNELTGNGITPRTHQMVPAAHFIEEPLDEFEHVIVLGFHDDTVETVAELLRRFRGTEVTIVADNEAGRERIRAAFLGERPSSGARFEVVGRKQLQVRDPDGRVCGIVNIRVADRYADGLFRPDDDSGPVGNLFDYDAAILLVERDGRTDPDGAATLGVLKLLDAWADGQHLRLRRVVAEVADPAKAVLLRQQVDGMPRPPQISFVCTSQLQQNILSHSFFVPGLPSVLHNLITVGGQELFAFRPASETGDMSWLELVGRLSTQDPPLVPVAISLKGHKPVVNPEPDTRFRWAEVGTIYALGTASSRAIEDRETGFEPPPAS